MTGKDNLLDLLRTHANSRGRVYLSPLRIRRMLGLSAHDVTKDLFRLQDEGLLDLTTKRNGKSVRITAMRLRPAGMYRDTSSEPTERPSEPREPSPGTDAPVDVQTATAVVPVTREMLDDADMLAEMRRPAFTRDEFPAIFALIDHESRREEVEEAARALERAGLDDLAVAAWDRVPDLTDEQREILQVVRFFRTPEWDQPGLSLRETLERYRDAG